LFLAFYFVGTKLATNKMSEKTAEVHGLDILFNPFSYLGAMGAVTSKPIEIQKESSFDFLCDSEELGSLGSDSIILDTGLPRKIYDKYLFAENFKAKKIQTISKAFEMPWRVADLIYVFPSKNEYCFYDAPSSFQEELEMLNYSAFSFDSDNCSENGIKVCFGSGNCDIQITSTEGNFFGGYVEKQQEKFYFAGQNYALLFGAIFSEKTMYDCNVQRLASRAEMEIQVYKEKQKALLAEGCTGQVNLIGLDNALSSLKERVTERNLDLVYQEAKNVENQNYNADCPLF